tara:strand:+ start:357 stop:1556 length:1200 start_codon:yes stop_codon:yes gene_type:complete
MKKKTYNDEINITDIIISLWNNKIKIIIITTAFLFLGILYFNSSNKNFTAITNIKPASTFEIEKYNIFNNFTTLQEDNDNEITENKTVINEKTFNIIKDKITSEVLLNLFIDKIKTRELVQKGVIKSKLVNKDNFQNEEDYEVAIQKKTIFIIDGITAPSINKENKNIPFWRYTFVISDKKKWKNFLEYIEKQANEEVRLFLLKTFNNKIETFNTESNHKLEDIEQKIEDVFLDYENKIAYKLAFLREQAEIARTLEIARTTLEIESFQTDKTIFETKSTINIIRESSYYLKGYEMIEKEISLIKSRKKTKIFIPKLAELERSKRELLQNKKVERLKSIYSKTPSNNKDEFIAGNIDYMATIYKPQQQPLSKILVISFLIGLVTSFIYITLNNLITSRK